MREMAVSSSSDHPPSVLLEMLRGMSQSALFCSVHIIALLLLTQVEEHG